MDGFNFYKACLTGSQHKWLNICSLFEEITRAIEPDSDLILVKYFTARVKGSYCKNPASPDRQSKYLIALQKFNSETIEVIEGTHVEVFTAGKHVVDGVTTNNWLDFCKMEEKQTDVNIALNMYRDCSQRKCEQVVLVSNDSDLKTALAFIKEDFPEVRRGLIQPNQSRPSKTLADLSHWTRRGIQSEDLRRHQLPDEVEYKNLGGRKTKRSKKPEGW